MSSDAPKVRKDRATIACQNCRQRKVRCMEPLVSPSSSSLTRRAGSGANPCADCTRLRKLCVYPVLERRRKRKRTANDQVDSRILGSPDDVLVSTELLNAAASTSSSPSNRPQLQSALAPELVSTSDAGIGKTPAPRDSNDHVMRESGWEYHEPWSWLSICSEVASRWVCGVTQSNEFEGMVSRFVKEFPRRTTSANTLPLTPISSDVDEETAWKYVDGKQQTLACLQLPLLSRKIRSFLQRLLGG